MGSCGRELAEDDGDARTDPGPLTHISIQILRKGREGPEPLADDVDSWRRQWGRRARELGQR
jgi:hypothetical protein